MTKIFVYKITREDGLQYIGITKRLTTRINQHSKSKRFSKLKISHFSILKECDLYEEAEKLEEYYIKFYDTYKNGLNVTFNGKGKNKNCKFNTLGFVYSEKSREKMKLNHWSKTKSYDQTGRKFSETSINKMSITRKGKCWRKKKISNEDMNQIIMAYANDSILLNQENFISDKGYKVQRKRAYANYFSRIYNVTHECILRILDGKRTT